METGFKRLKVKASCRQPSVPRDLVAGVIGIPDHILIGTAEFPSHLITASRLLGRNRCPRPELTRIDVRARIFQRWPRATAIVQKEPVRNLRQTRRPKRFNDSRDCSDNSISIQVLMETGFKRLKVIASCRQPSVPRGLVAVAIGIPHH